jgi:2,3-bisphosphoglycerate-dependent phosphoglycerate mutase
MKNASAVFLFALAQLAPAAASAQQEIILVRHAELQGAAMADPKSLPLSADGKARAQRLASILKDSGVGAIYVTDFARTNQTAQPLSQGIDRPLTVVPKGDPQELVERLRKNHAGQVVLLVGHTDTLPGLIKALGCACDIKIDAQDYGNLFIVTPKGDGAAAFLRLRY